MNKGAKAPFCWLSSTKAHAFFQKDEVKNYTRNGTPNLASNCSAIVFK